MPIDVYETTAPLTSNAFSKPLIDFTRERITSHREELRAMIENCFANSSCCHATADP
jgi:hypothetical protein